MKKIIIFIFLTISMNCAYGQIPLGHHLFSDNSVFMNIRELIYDNDAIYCIAGVQKPDTSKFEYRSYQLNTEFIGLELIDTLIQNTDFRGGVSGADNSFFKLPSGDYFCDIVDLKIGYAILNDNFYFKQYTYIENNVGRVNVARLLRLANDTTIVAVVEHGPDEAVRDRYIYNYDLDLKMRWRRLLPTYLDRTFLGDLAIIRDSIIVVSQYSETFNGEPVRNAVSVHTVSTGNYNFRNRIVEQDSAGATRPQIVYNAEQDIVALSVGKVFKLYCCAPQFIHGLMALDKEWNIIWQKRQSFEDGRGSEFDYFNKSIPSQEGDAIISAGNALDNGWVINISKTGWDGDSIWTRRIVYDFGLPYTVSSRLWDLDASPDGGYAISGSASYNDIDTISRQEGWILKVDSAGCVVSGCDQLVSTSEPSSSDIIIKVYPNPSPDEFQFVVGSSRPLSGLVRIVNPQGQVVRTYDHEGSHVTYTVSLGDAPSGVYILQYMDKDGTVSEKIVKQ